jgi:polar amino acid transport system substrate-binding protein
MLITTRPGHGLTRRALCATGAAALLLPATARAGDIRISVAELPNGVSTAALSAAMKIAFGKLAGTTLELTTAPFARSIGSVLAGDVDLHIPIIRPPHEDKAPYAVTTATILQTTFVLYTNKDKPIDKADLGKYKIETEPGHVGYFDFPVAASAGFEPSMQKLAAGRIDGYIFAGATIDPILERLKLTSIHREVFKQFDVAAAMAKSAKGGPIDQLFSQAMQGVADDPAFKAETQKILAAYRGPDWQMS